MSGASAEDDVFAGTTDAVEGGEDLGMFDASTLMSSYLRAMRSLPRVAHATTNLATELARIATGRSALEPERGDWRFPDATWNENPAFRILKQAYLAWSDSIMEAMDDPELEWHAAERARFAGTMLTSAMSPTNFFWTNPAAVKRAVETGGASVVRGLRNMAGDVRHNGGMPSQTARGALQVGRDLAITPGSVVFRNDQCEVIRYQPTTDNVRKRPVVLITPQINKYYFLDLRPGRSFVEYEVSRGIQVFMVSWRNPHPEHAAWGFDEYASTILEVIDAARSLTGSEDVDLFGFCAGGITMTGVLNELTAQNDDRVASASFAVTLLDFEIPALIGMLAQPGLLRMAKWNSHRAGVLAGRSLGQIFNWFRPNDLVWNYWVNNYLLGNDPPVFDILAWNADSTNLPARLHGQFMDIFGRNLLTKPGAFQVLGTPVDLSTIKVDTYVTGATTDHLTPWMGCYRTTQLLSGPSTFVLSNAGHIQSMINPPGNPKAFYYAGPEPEADPEAWMAAAERRPGTWWEHWADWALARQPAEAPAPRKLGNTRYPALCEAPGTYVLERL
jgi:polyhydroxyalkanoate synthase